MNERIKQLAEQAISFRLDPDSKCYEALIHPEDLELFAELIVKECAEHLESSVLVPKIPREKFSEHSRVKWKCIRAIKEHFGVEP